ncbi:hypothetical protein [Marinomonas sp. 2405UD68-3]|uniref:hypothetical protein n=1 Tax=Marinomonas sp. 2405UD68-3 TaxID=3391835 RepID=UPI0039C9A502
MNKSKKTLHDKSVAQCVSDFIDDRISSDDLNFLLSQEDEEWKATLNAYAATQKALSSSEPMVDFSQFDLLSRVREGIDGIEPDQLPDQSNAEPANVVDLLARKAELNDTDSANLGSSLSSASLSHDSLVNKEQRKNNIISVKTFAMVASVAFVVVLGGQLFLSQDSGFASGEGGSVETVASLDQTHSILDNPQDIKTLSLDVHNDRLQSYLRQHAEQSAMATNQGMISMARIVSFSVENDDQ